MFNEYGAKLSPNLMRLQLEGNLPGDLPEDNEEEDQEEVEVSLAQPTSSKRIKGKKEEEDDGDSSEEEAFLASQRMNQRKASGSGRNS